MQIASKEHFTRPLKIAHLNETISKEQALETLSNIFQIKDFRDGQWEVIDALINSKKKILLVEKTGFGKSLCFQLPAVFFPGLTIVFSPLIALMRDQAEKMKKIGINAATFNSGNTADEKNEAIEQIKNRTLELIYIAPERLEKEDWFEIEKWAHISMIVIDEAHCISTWGHDFRPNYRFFLPFIKQNLYFDSIPILALTATANKEVQDDIKKQIGEDLVVIQRSLTRNNLHLSVNEIGWNKSKKESFNEKIEWLEIFFHERQIKSKQYFGIIYTGTRKDTEKYALHFQKMGYNTDFYHAGIGEHAEDKSKRKELELKVMNNELDFIFSTNALGMGIDKPDIRFIIHTQFPGSPIAYYQEVGRAGRDGNPSEIFLLADVIHDKALQEYFISISAPEIEFYVLIFDRLIKGSALKQDLINTIINTVSQRIRKNDYTEEEVARKIVSCVLADLIEQKLVEKNREFFYINDKNSYFNENQIKSISTRKKKHLEGIIMYIRYTDCRMQYLCNYLDDNTSKSCMKCDNCKTQPNNVVFKPYYIDKNIIPPNQGNRENYGMAIDLAPSDQRQFLNDYSIKTRDPNTVIDWDTGEESKKYTLITNDKYTAEQEKKRIEELEKQRIEQDTLKKNQAYIRNRTSQTPVNRSVNKIELNCSKVLSSDFHFIEDWIMINYFGKQSLLKLLFSLSLLKFVEQRIYNVDYFKLLNLLKSQKNGIKLSELTTIIANKNDDFNFWHNTDIILNGNANMSAVYDIIKKYLQKELETFDSNDYCEINNHFFTVKDKQICINSDTFNQILKFIDIQLLKRLLIMKFHFQESKRNPNLNWSFLRSNASLFENSTNIKYSVEDILFAAQFGRCFICGEALTNDRSYDIISYDKTGNISGLVNYFLCHENCKTIALNETKKEAFYDQWVDQINVLFCLDIFLKKFSSSPIRDAINQNELKLNMTYLKPKIVNPMKMNASIQYNIQNFLPPKRFKNYLLG